MKITKNPGVFRFKPYCCAEIYIGNNKYRKVNWLWFYWMFTFKYNRPFQA